MLFKLSLKNIKKSFKDYSVYFFTLVLAVAMFYIFNSVDAQTSMMKLNSSKSEIVEALMFMLQYVSIFVSIVLGFLIVYSNNFLIKRRKKEMGIYLTLGMSKRKVSFILLIETILIGIISLFIGLGLGIFLSQFLSILTAKIFEVDMDGFTFIFSNSAFLKAIIYFGIIFTLVMLFSVISVSKCKLIDLINAHRKNEKVKFRNTFTIIISFILAILLIGYAYYLLFDGALLMMNKKTIYMLLFGSVGTFFLFFSLSGFLVRVIKKFKSFYYKKLNMFVLKQINNRINTNVVSNTIICLMLLLTIGILSGSISMADVFNKDFAANNLTDFTVNVPNAIYHTDDEGIVSLSHELGIDDINNLLSSKEFNNYVGEYVKYNRYTDFSVRIRDLMTENDVNNLIKEYGSSMSIGYPVVIISESDYDKIMKLYNMEKDIIDIKDNEYLLFSNIDFAVDCYTDFYKNGGKITVNNIELSPASNKVLNLAFENYNSNGNDGIVVVSDNLVNDLLINTVSIIGNYSNQADIEKTDEAFSKHVSSSFKNYSYIRTRIEMEAASVGLKLILIFMGLYLGITFALCSATVLAIAQLSEASDNKERYQVLKDIGANKKDINRALFSQIAISFTFPLIIAIIHSIVGLGKINKMIKMIGNIDLTANIFLTSLFIIILYGGYFLITYIASKNIITKD